MNIQNVTCTAFESVDKHNLSTTPVSHFYGFIQQTIDAWRKHRELRKMHLTDRAAFEHMLHVEDRILEDIGVTRDDVIWASKLPLSKNAALELQRVSKTGGHQAAQDPGD